MIAVKHFTARVVGVTFVDGYPDNLLALGIENEAADAKGERLVVVLRRNPNNEYDSNAVEVHVPALGDYGMIGHLPRDVAAKLAPNLDAGETWGAEVEHVWIDPEHIDRPGISISIWKMEEENN